jgi:alpha-tubulin suppressor-like RCC1 family protein/phosphoheptose isomerase
MKTTMTKNNIFTLLVLMVNLLFVSSVLGKEPLDGSTKNSNSKPILTATPVAGIWQTIAAGTSNTFGIKNDGTLWAWGRNNYGRLGDGTTTDRFSPVQIGTANNWKGIAASDDFTVGLKTDGTLWGWGSNYYGGFGDGTSGTVTNKNTPTQIGTATNWQSISAGLSHTVGLKTDGTIWAWGYNYMGQLGDGTSGTGANKNIPTQIGTETNWKSVSAGDYHTIGLKNDGTLWAWGSNSGGTLGDGTYTSSNIPVQAGFATNWQSISAGNDFNVGIKTDGTLWAWGYNNLTQLGLGASSLNIKQNSPVQIGILTNWQSISAKDNHTGALKTDGTLWAWGYGNFGDGTNNPWKYTPQQIGTANDWQSISAGDGHFAGLKTDCLQFVATGSNQYGQLGDGTGVDAVGFICITEAVTYTLTCPPNRTVNTGPGSCSAVVNDIDPIITPAGGGVNYTIGNISSQGSVSGFTFNKGVITVTYAITSDPSKTCSFTVTVIDNQAPVLVCPSNQTIDVIANTSAANYTIVDPISDLCTESTWGYTLTGATTGTKSGISDYTGSGVLSFNKGVTTVTLSGTDGTNISTTCSFTVTVIDNQAPVLVCPDNQTLNVIATTCAASYTIADPISDNSTSGTWGYTLTGATTGTLSGIADGTGSGVLSFNKGVTTVTLSGTDGTNNASPCSFTVTVSDNQAPVLACPSNQTLDVITNTTAANYTIVDPLSDNCTGSTWGYVLTGATTGTQAGIADGTGSGVLSFNKGITTVTLSGTDGTNEASPCSFTVTVLDDQNPTIIAPVTVIVAADAGKCTASGVALGTPTIGDNCMIANVSNDAVEPFALGDTSVIWTITDGSGNTATATQTVTVTPNVTIGTVSGTSPLCWGETATYTSTGDVGGVWSSSNESVASVNASGLVTPLSAGTTEIRYTLSGCNEPVSAYKTLTVNPTTGPTMFTSGAKSLCQDAADETYTATAEGSTSIVYSVLPLSAGTLGASSGVMNWDALFSGVATITATSTGLCGTTSTDRVVVVNSLPIADAGSPATILPGNSVTIGTTALEGNSYSWVSDPAGFTSVVANPTVSPTVTTTYTLTVSKTATGCTNSNSVTITVANQLPTANAGVDQTVYYGYPPTQCTTLYGSASGGTPPYHYSWSNGAVTESTSVCPMTTTIFTLTVKDANGSTATDAVTVYVIDVSCGNNKVKVCHQNKTVCIAIPAVKVHLAHGDSLGDCTNNSGIAVNTAPTDSMVLYPNPTAGSFTVEVYKNNVVESALLQVVDFNGHLIYAEAPFRIDGHFKGIIDLNQAALPDGIYFLQLIIGEKTETQKIILKK